MIITFIVENFTRNIFYDDNFFEKVGIFENINEKQQRLYIREPTSGTLSFLALSHLYLEKNCWNNKALFFSTL